MDWFILAVGLGGVVLGLALSEGLGALDYYVRRTFRQWDDRCE